MWGSGVALHLLGKIKKFLSFPFYLMKFSPNRSSMTDKQNNHLVIYVFLQRIHGRASKGFKLSPSFPKVVASSGIHGGRQRCWRALQIFHISSKFLLQSWCDFIIRVIASACRISRFAFRKLVCWTIELGVTPYSSKLCFVTAAHCSRNLLIFLSKAQFAPDAGRI